MTHTQRFIAAAALAVLLVSGMQSVARANAPEDAGRRAVAIETESLTPELNWSETLRSGRWPMGVLGALSVLTLALVIYFLVVLRVKPISPPALQRELLECIRAGELEEARRVCDYRPCPLSLIVLAALEYLRHVGRTRPHLLKDVVQGEGQRQAGNIEGQIQYLQDIAVIAPMIGLLGTVLGMLRAFRSVAADIAQAQPIVLADGVSQALVTTAFGLIVGIAAMMFHAYFKRRAAGLIFNLEADATEILTALTSLRGIERDEEDA